MGRLVCDELEDYIYTYNFYISGICIGLAYEAQALSSIYISVHLSPVERTLQSLTGVELS